MGDLLIIPVVVPMLAGFLLLFLPARFRFTHGAVALLLSAGVFAFAVALFCGDDCSFFLPILNLGGMELDLALRATALGVFFFLFAALFGFLITLYAVRGGAPEKANLYYGSILLAIGGAAGILLADHLLLLLICWEIVTAALYLLVSTGGRHANFAATKSFAMIGFSDGAFLLGAVMVWALTGTFRISAMGLFTSGPMVIIAFLLLMTAAITKAGAMPLHTWVPTSGEYAPTSVMALLPAAVDKLLGIYLLVLCVGTIFILESPALSLVLAIIGTGTILVAVMVAMMQHNLKKLLSYHAVSQVGYMILGIATLTPVGIAGGVFHMLNNAIYKCCLFLGSGAVERSAGTTELDELGGLGRNMPVTFTCFFIAALSISGVPPFNGFVSKWMVYQGVVEMGSPGSGSVVASLWPLWLAAAVFGSALTLASFVKLLHSVFLSRLPGRLENTREVPALMTVPMIVLAALCIGLGVYYVAPLQSLIYPALAIEPGTVIIGSWHSMLATTFLLMGLIVGLLVLWFAKMEKKIKIVPTWDCGESQDNEDMIVPGTDFYKTVSRIKPLDALYAAQEKGYFDLYDQAGRVGLSLTGLLRKLHSGILPTYLTWVILGFLLILCVLLGHL